MSRLGNSISFHSVKMVEARSLTSGVLTIELESEDGWQAGCAELSLHLGEPALVRNLVEAINAVLAKHSPQSIAEAAE